jgi:2-haloacid dehalogenase
MKYRPQVVAFDVIETLFSLEPMRARLHRFGLPNEALELWFARLLRNAFALDASGSFTSFGEVARATLDVMLAENRLTAETEDVNRALSGLAELPAHPDVAPAFQWLRAASIRVVALTNGHADNTRGLLQRAGLSDVVERVISIDEIRRWKPAREIYLHAAHVCGVAPGQLALVAAHAWDVHGASQAGLVTGWVSRLEKHYFPAMNPPDVTGSTLVEVVRQLSAMPQEFEIQPTVRTEKGNHTIAESAPCN